MPPAPAKQSAEPGSVLIGPGTVGPFGKDGVSAASPLPQAPFAFGQGADITPHFHLGGLMGGGTGGCQYQWGAWVFGIEADGGPVDKQGQSNDQAPFNPQFVNQTNERSLATLRGRLGYAVDKWLFYATGGVAWAQRASNVLGWVQRHGVRRRRRGCLPRLRCFDRRAISRGCRCHGRWRPEHPRTSRPWSATR